MKKQPITFVCILAITSIIAYYTYKNCNALCISRQLPYAIEDVTYLNTKSGLHLAGTLTIPHAITPCPAVILVAGTGRHERNCTMKGHKLFEAMADSLSRQGIAVLRYDKRGVEKSQGTFDTTLTTQDFADDAQAGLAYLMTRKDINPHQIGFIGHSEGGLVICMVAAVSDDVQFLILMGGAASTKIADIVEQACMQLRADGASEEIISLDRSLRTEMLTIVHEEPNLEIANQLLHEAVKKHLENLTTQQKNQAESLVFESAKTYFEPQAPVYAISALNAEYMIKVFNSPWIRFLLAYDAPATLQKITVPTAIINGEFDFIVAQKVTRPIFEANLQNCPYTITEIQSVNHWFETCPNGSIREYGKTREIISPVFIKVVDNLVQDNIRRLKEIQVS